MNPESRTIDEQMDRSIGRELAEPDLTELLEPPGQRRVIGDREVPTAVEKRVKMAVIAGPP